MRADLSDVMKIFTKQEEQRKEDRRAIKTALYSLLVTLAGTGIATLIVVLS